MIRILSFLKQIPCSIIIVLTSIIALTIIVTLAIIIGHGGWWYDCVPQIPFDPVKWEEGSINDMRHRMLKDLTQNHLKTTMTRNDIEKILGKPDREFHPEYVTCPRLVGQCFPQDTDTRKGPYHATQIIQNQRLFERIS